MNWILRFFRRSRDYDDLSREISQHLKEKVEVLMQNGMTRVEAEQAARREFGNVVGFEEQSRDALGWRWLEDFFADLRYGARQLFHNRLFTAAALATLALAIGACSSIFSVVNAVLLRELPYKDADRLILIWGTGGRTINRDQISFTDLQDWRKNSHFFEEVANYHSYVYTLTEAQGSQRLRALQVSDGYFRVMQSKPYLGRFFVTDDFTPGKQQVAVLSYDFWQQRFAGDSAILGRTISLNFKPFVIIGIAPPDLASLPNSVIFRPPSQLYTPVIAEYSDASRDERFLRGIGLLKAGILISQAQAELDVLVAEMQKRYPNQDGGRGVRLVRLKDDLVRNVRLPLIILQLAVLLVVLIACANVANLLLARSTVRHREIAIRGALGASRTRLIRQLVTESLLLAFLGGSLGVLLASLSVRFLTRLGTNVLPELSGVSIDPPVLIFTIAISLITGLIFGAVPAFQCSAIDVTNALKSGARAVGLSSSQSWTRSLLVAAEVAVSVVLLIAAGLLMKSFVLLQHVDPGFNPHHTGMTYIHPPRLQDAPIAQQQAFFTALLARISALPGVESAGITSGVPDSGDFDHIRISIKGQAVSASQRPSADRFVVSPGYFSTLRIPLLKGRLFNLSDDGDHPRVVLINELLAQQLFPGQDPIGQQVQIPTPGDFTKETEPYWTIVGVVGDVVQNGLASRKTMQIYAPYTQYDCAASNLLFRTGADPMLLAASLRAALHDLDSSATIPEFVAMDDVLAGSIVEQRFSTTLLTIFGICGLLLAVIGIYGVISYGVAQRTPEFGTRIALGAAPADIVRLVLRQGMRPVLIGSLAGLMACVPATRLIERLLFKTSRLDPATFALVVVFLLAAALAACYVPAYRATRVNPLEALRAE
jgi:putative ABC transport system permease protein